MRWGTGYSYREVPRRLAAGAGTGTGMWRLRCSGEAESCCRKLEESKRLTYLPYAMQTPTSAFVYEKGFGNNTADVAAMMPMRS